MTDLDTIDNRFDMVKLGREVEETIKEFLLSLEGVAEVERIGDTEAVKGLSMDLKATMRNGACHPVEVKTDRVFLNSENIAVEVMEIHHRGLARNGSPALLGWTLRTSARFIFYYDPDADVAWSCLASDLKACWANYTGKKRDKTGQRWINTNNKKSTLIHLIPFSECERLFVKHEDLRKANTDQVAC